jgi:hypothetical protein
MIHVLIYVFIYAELTCSISGYLHPMILSYLTTSVALMYAYQVFFFYLASKFALKS